MSAYDNATLIMLPGGRKVGKIYSQKPTNGTGDFTFTRNLVKYVKGKTGLLEEVAANVPAFEWVPERGRYALSIEPARTNLLIYSDQYSNAAWSKTKTDLAAPNTETAPDNSATADSIKEQAGVNEAHYVAQSVVKAASVIQYTFSVFVKNNGRNVRLSISDGTANNRATVIFNTTTGAILVNPAVAGTYTNATATAKQYLNGWLKLSITAYSGNEASIETQIHLTDGVNLSYDGDITKGVILWGAQLEAAANFSSYIKTAAAAVARPADVATVTVTPAINKITQNIAGVETIITDIPTGTFTAPEGNIESLIFESTGNQQYIDYVTRVAADSGVIKSTDFLEDYVTFLQAENRYNAVKVLLAPQLGSKRRVVGVNTYITKLHSVTLTANDAAQATELNQPFLAGNVAPNERYALQNPNNGTRTITHNNVSFLANEAWTLTVAINYNGNNEASGGTICGGGTNGVLYLRIGDENKVRLYSDDAQALAFPVDNTIIGKNIVLTLTADGLGNLKLYKNGTFIATVAGSTKFIFSKLINAYGVGTSRLYNGKIYSYLIQSGALTAPQVTAEYNLLRAWLPEISNVTIGAQQWASSNLDVISTPQGNLINEVQINTYTERVINGGFDTDTAWSKEEPATITISGGAAHFNNTTKNYSIYQTVPPLVANKWYKLTYTILNYVKGSIRFASSNSVGITRNANGTYIEYVKAGNNTLYLSCQADGGTTLDIDNVLCQEVGWANSQELYDAVYAATAGTVEQKTYAAVKAAAMWSYYNNDPVTGAVYAKLYNWFAAKLLQMDIDYYNAANPAAPWGWRVPVDADFTAMITALGGANIAGGKMKVTGTGYYSAPNTGADNISGLSILPSGYRAPTGPFNSINTQARVWSLTEIVGGTAANYYILDNTNTTIVNSGLEKIRGNSIRLIKS